MKSFRQVPALQVAGVDIAWRAPDCVKISEMFISIEHATRLRDWLTAALPDDSEINPFVDSKKGDLK